MKTIESKLDLMLHPVRLRLVLALSGTELTTHQLVRSLGDVPASSVYRHVNLLIAAGLVEVAAERPVRGTVEKTLRVTAGAHIGAEEARAMTAEDHRRSVLAFLTQLMREWETYLGRADVDLGADIAGYSLANCYATDVEWQESFEQIGTILRPLTENGPGEGRRRRRLATMTWPAPEQPVLDDEEQS
ncbi:MAG TPA: helix-turn-helix domain-containing protein [Herpetosiphonaceae bacterium]|nr:helix-turn-helix domain-containing protein [Herpetosiphonaceae bacterium]